MRCFARTSKGRRCARDARLRRLTCAKHRRQLLVPATTLTTLTTGAALWVGLTSDGLDIWDKIFGEPKPKASTAAECIGELASKEFSDRVIDSWLCETQFANVWDSEKQHGVLWDNRPLVEENYSRIMHAAASPATPLSAAALEDPDLSGGTLSRLYARWPTYQTLPSIVLGQVRAATNLADDTVSSDWVIQLGTARDEHQLLYLRVVGPPGWAPPPRSECQLALGEAIPIARGFVPRADQGGTYDVIYAMAATFECLTPMGEEVALGLRDVLPPELQDAFDEGASLDRW